MFFKSFLSASLAAVFFATPTLAQDISVSDSYARSASPAAKSGAAFLVIMNNSDQADRLIGVATEAAKRAELHTHEENADGVMAMRHVEDGFALPANGMIMMGRGGKHVMLMGLTEPLKQGDLVGLTLSFESAGEIKVNVPVDLERKPGSSHSHGMSSD